jgi:outer membrane protein assembly factor BamB
MAACGGVTALDIATSHVVWTSPYIDSDSSSLDAPTILGARLYLGTSDGEFVALSLATGDVLWSSTVPAGKISAPTPMGSLILFSDGNEVIALNKTTGSNVWTFTAPSSLSNGNLSDPAVSGPNVYLVSNWFVFSLSSKGKLVWRTPINNADSYNSWDADDFSNPLVNNGMVYAWAMAGDTGAELEAVSTSGPPSYNPADPTGCYAAWCIQGYWATGDLAMEQGTLFASFDNSLESINGQTGSVNWSDTGSGAYGLAVVNGVVFSSGVGAFNTANGVELLANDPCATPAAIYGSNVLCGTWSQWGSLDDLGFGQMPSFTSAASVSFSFSLNQSFTITTSGSPSPTEPTVLSLKGALPAGMTFKDGGNGTGVIAGTPRCTGSACSVAKTYQVTLSATQGIFSAQQDLTIGVNPAG